MYKFERFGTLMYYNGLPVYAGNKLITERRLVKWWPINWFMVLVVAPAIIYRELKYGNKDT